MSNKDVRRIKESIGLNGKGLYILKMKLKGMRINGHAEGCICKFDVGYNEAMQNWCRTDGYIELFVSKMHLG